MAFDASPMGMAFLSGDFRIVEPNRALCRMLGRTEDELRGRIATDFTHPDDVRLNAEQHARLVAGEIDGYDLEAHSVYADGRIGWVSLHVGAVARGSGGEVVRAIAVIEDITEQRQMREIHDRLLGLVLVGQGADALATTLAELIHAPVALLDGYGQTLALGDHEGRSAVVPARDELAGPHDGLTVRPLRVAERIEGYLLAEVPEDGRRLTAMAIEQAASSFALQLAITRTAEEVEHRLHGDLFDALLSESPPPIEELLRWGARLGHDLSGFRVVAFLRPTGLASSEVPGAITRLTRTARAAADSSAAGSLTVPRGDAVLVVSTAKTRADGRRMAEHLVERIHLLAGEDVVVGMAGEVSDPAGLAEAMREARQAVDAISALPRLGPLAHFDDLGMHHLLVGKKPAADVRDSARKTLAPLLELPSPQSDKLVATLATYLDSLGGLETSARRLGVHVNTLRQRVHRIEELLARDLQDARTRVDLQLALDVLELGS